MLWLEERKWIQISIRQVLEATKEEEDCEAVLEEHFELGTPLKKSHMHTLSMYHRW